MPQPILIKSSTVSGAAPTSLASVVGGEPGFRGTYAGIGIGYRYDEERDEFVPPVTPPQAEGYTGASITVPTAELTQ